MHNDAFNESSSNCSLKDKLIFIAGGTGGLGSSTAACLLSQKAQLIINYIKDAHKPDQDEGKVLQKKLHDIYGSEAILIEADISTQKGRDACLETVKSTKQPLYAFICFVGKAVRIPFTEITDKELLESFQINTVSPILLARDFYPFLKLSIPEAAIIFISSMQAVIPFSHSIPYALPKFCLHHAAKILAKEWSGRGGIRVNVVAPGVNEAGMALASIQAGKYKKYIEKNAIPRYGKAEDIARAISFLIQPDNYITGQILTVDGGLTLNA